MYNQKTAAATQVHLIAFEKLHQHFGDIIRELEELTEEKETATPFNAIEGYGEVILS